MAYRRPPAPKRGLADRDTKNPTKAVFGCLLALGLALGLTAALPLLGIGLAHVADDRDDGWMLVTMGALAPCGVLGLFVVAVPLVALSRRSRGGADGGLLAQLQPGLGGELVQPRWYQIGLPPTLRTRIGSEPARLTALATVRRRRARAAALRLLIQEPWAQIGPAGLWRGVEIRLWMYTNHAVPSKVAFVSRTKLAGLGAGLAKLTEVRLPGPMSERIACFARDPARVGPTLTRPEVAEGIREIVESNLPYVTQLSFEPEGAIWCSAATNQTGPEHMAWRFERMRWIAQQLGGGPAR